MWASNYKVGKVTKFFHTMEKFFQAVERFFQAVEGAATRGTMLNQRDPLIDQTLGFTSNLQSL